MHPLINRSIFCFLRDTYGVGTWRRVALSVGLMPDAAEALMAAGGDEAERLVAAAAEDLGKPQAVLLEDMGTYLVSHPNAEAVRRLLRFSGETFEEFLHSLEDLPGRARLAVNDLVLPAMDVLEEGDSIYRVRVPSADRGFQSVLTGVLRAMADDYGALVMLETEERAEVAAGEGEAELRSSILVTLHDSMFAEGKHFELSGAGRPW